MFDDQTQCWREDVLCLACNISFCGELCILWCRGDTYLRGKTAIDLRRMLFGRQDRTDSILAAVGGAFGLFGFGWCWCYCDVKPPSMLQDTHSTTSSPDCIPVIH